MNHELVVLIVLIAAVGAIIRSVARPYFTLRSRRALGSAADAALEARLARVESALEAMAVDSQRLADGQRFLTQLLADRGAGAGDPAGHAANDQVARAGRRP